MSRYERGNRNVLRRCLKTASDGAAVTWAGRSFHTAAPEAVNVQLPTVDRRMIGTCKRSEPDERSRRLDGMSATRDHTVLHATHTRTFSCLYIPAAKRHRPLAGTHCAYPRRDGQAELTCVAGYNVPHRELNPDTVTHPSTNRAWRRLTLLIQISVLPLRQTTTFHGRLLQLLRAALIELFAVRVLWCRKWLLSPRKTNAHMIPYSSFYYCNIPYSVVPSYGALGHVPPSTSNNFILVHFGVNLTANYLNIV